MKVSISLPDDDVDFLDRYSASQGMGSRSAAVHKAVRLLRASELGPAYEDAWAEWVDAADDGTWDNAISDGLG